MHTVFYPPKKLCSSSYNFLFLAFTDFYTVFVVNLDGTVLGGHNKHWKLIVSIFHIR